MNPNLVPQALAILVPVLIWSLAWKGVALWRAARNGQKAWFVVLLVLNTIGLLEIVYVLGFSKKEDKKISV
ncbi:MAG: hypothetical protein HGB34_01240 [Candidatus Moranbacteria bacterium]|nr:hypothetical protein [Candidatus Moranbacteria bacterium]HWQ59921.1 DUF5652 family protein [Candidatus Fimivivens sp.]